MSNAEEKRKWQVPGPNDDDHAHFEYRIYIDSVLALGPLQPSNNVEIKRMKKITAMSLLEELAEKIREDGRVDGEDHVARKLINFLESQGHVNPLIS